MNEQNSNNRFSDRFMRIAEILSVIPIGRSTWWKWVAEGKAPKPVKLGPRTTAWKADEVYELIAQLEEQGRVS